MYESSKYSDQTTGPSPVLQYAIASPLSNLSNSNGVGGGVMANWKTGLAPVDHTSHLHSLISQSKLWVFYAKHTHWVQNEDLSLTHLILC